ncbi:MAG TPA: Holliday junction resolvase RuvX [Candidatus Faecisoma merdavium]|nr:Holliday junction resolvase RuvX [Candidatus Faecisoma merdavium]
MNYLGLDLGTKTLGLAISKGVIATTLKTIRYDDIDKLIEQLNEIILDNKIDIIVLGMPKNMNNTIGPRAIETLEFKQKLENLNYNVVLQDERLSTVSAHNYMIKADLSRKKRKEKVDALAATIILQTYLDKENNNERRTNEI